MPIEGDTRRRDLRSMKQRWRAAVALSEWRAIATAERNRLLGELEDMQREALSSGQRAEAAAIAAAVDLLDCVAADGALATWERRRMAHRAS
jgi:hypothetical protein